MKSKNAKKLRQIKAEIVSRSIQQGSCPEPSDPSYFIWKFRQAHIDRLKDAVIDLERK